MTTENTIQIREAPPAPLEIIAREIAKGNLSVDVIERLAALQERMDADAARKAFSAAMAACQAEMPRIGKLARNPSTGSAYAPLEHVQELAKPVYQRHGFSLSFSEQPHPTPGWTTCCMLVRHVGGHTETHVKSGPCDNKGMKGNPTKSELHGMASTGTYLMRYLICGVFNLTLGASDGVPDDDGNGGGEPDVQRVTQEQADTIVEMVEQSGIVGLMTGILKWAGIERIDDLPADKYAATVSGIKAKIAKAVKP